MLRRAAPQHTLMWGGREWCSPASLLETVPPADPNTVAEVHDYAGGDAAEIERRFAGQTVPRPANWGGFRLLPERIEFWFGRPDRLHDRLLYVRQPDGWSIQRLYP